ncbi:hypothetical protein STEG23_008883, partial [Scotinomys teguina]
EFTGALALMRENPLGRTHSFAPGPGAKEGEADVEETEKGDVLQATRLENWFLAIYSKGQGP